MTDPSTPATLSDGRRLRCPRCTEPLLPLALSSHRHARLTVDHCAGCRMVWFDALESVQLDALGWVRLLRAMERGLALPLAMSQVARPACPLCTTPLKPVRNRSRYGAFAVLECPEGHGHLHSHAGLLAERGLVRPLGLPERRALASGRHPLRCLNCGGPASLDDVHCSWCGTALVVLDLPRLAHSLQVRDAAMGPSPAQRGRHVAWACRGCGAPLDPARDTACRSCGHLVVASELPDLDPLLDAAEAALADAAARTARVRERFPSGRQAPAEAPARVSTRRERPGWGWRGWAPLAALGAAGALLFGVVLGVGRPSVDGLLAQRLGREPARLWATVVQHEALADAASHRQLALAVLELHLRQLTGDEWPADWRLSRWLERRPDTVDIRRHWRELVNASLVWQPAREADEPPEDAAPAGTRLSPAAPGAWVEADARSVGLWAPQLRHAGSVPVPVDELSATIDAGAVDTVAWRCVRADAGAPAWLAPGDSVRLLCRSQVSPQMLGSTWTQAMHALRAGQPGLAWEDLGHASEAGLVQLANRFADRHGGQADSLPLAARWAALSGPRLLAACGAALLLGLAVFCGLARVVGERAATLGVLATSLPLFTWLSIGTGAAVPLLVFGGVSATAGVLFGYRYVFRWYRDAAAQWGRRA
ncbi:zf-TFIIB domain-containing protein [Ideonella sp.]|uniref:TFIIB-type zinc ribbon-containing protein n=1 Tax=Ideonella sp. TaxID=1929293 RepID=UPI0035B0B608